MKNISDVRRCLLGAPELVEGLGFRVEFRIGFSA
jgi:hypothetical protein